MPEGSSTTPINISLLPKGVYILRLNNGKEQTNITDGRNEADNLLLLNNRPLANDLHS
jgi:hypothetical protein